jgi:YARHG domain
MQIFSPDGKYGYVCSSFNPETVVISVAEHAIVGHVAQASPFCPDLAATPDGNQVWFTLKDVGKTQVFDAQPPFARARHLLRRVTPAGVAIATAVAAAVGYLALDVMDWLRIRESVETADFEQHQHWFLVDLFSAPVAAKLAGESEWREIEQSKVAAELRAFMDQYPASVYADFARLRLGRLEAITAGRYTPVIADSSKRLLSQAELQPLKCDQLWKARNEITYSLGYCFVSKTASDAFHTSTDCPRSCQVVKNFNQWIYDRVESTVERTNINTIQAIEQQNHCQIAVVPGPCDQAR